MAVREWLWRYAPAEVAATAGALAAATATNAFGVAAATAYASAIGETLAFYVVILFRDFRRSLGPHRQTLTSLIVEFGPAEIADTFAVRPLAMYLGPLLIGHLAAGVLAGKIAADVVFYVLAIVGYELRKATTARRRDPFAAAALDSLRYRTPYLLMDLDRVAAAYRALLTALPVDAIHYAVKCNPDRRVLQPCTRRAPASRSHRSPSWRGSRRSASSPPTCCSATRSSRPSTSRRRTVRAAGGSPPTERPSSTSSPCTRPASAVYVRLRRPPGRERRAQRGQVRR